MRKVIYLPSSNSNSKTSSVSRPSTDDYFSMSSWIIIACCLACSLSLSLYASSQYCHWLLYCCNFDIAKMCMSNVARFIIIACTCVHVHLYETASSFSPIISQECEQKCPFSLSVRYSIQILIVFIEMTLKSFLGSWSHTTFCLHTHTRQCVVIVVGGFGIIDAHSILIAVSS